MSNARSFPRWLAALLALLVFATASRGLRAEEVIPAKPTRYFNDYALTVKPETADRLNQELEDLEKQTSNQILVAIYPTMQTDSSVDDYCLRIFRAWQVGDKDKNNGAVLFVFLDQHKTWIQTGSGIQGGLTDARCKDITADIIAPRFKAGDFDGGLTAGVEAMIAASKGEQQGDGQTQYQKQHAGDNAAGGGIGFGTILFLIFLFFFISRAFRGRGGGAMYTGGGPVFFPIGGFGGGGGFGGDSGGGGSFSGGSSDGGGSFSSGGGDTNGGGAGSDW